MEALFDNSFSEAERRREEAIELRALLASKFEHGASPKAAFHKEGSPSSVSTNGEYSYYSSGDEEASMGAIVERELCAERQCREQKQMILCVWFTNFQAVSFTKSFAN